MTIASERLYTVLTADAAVSGVIGTRCYPYEAPQDMEPPSIAYEVTTEPVWTLHPGQPTTNNATVNVYCIARPDESSPLPAEAVAKDLADKAQTALNLDRFRVVNRAAAYDSTNNLVAVVLTALHFEE